jgi:hypothetical protein
MLFLSLMIHTHALHQITQKVRFFEHRSVDLKLYFPDHIYGRSENIIGPITSRPIFYVSACRVPLRRCLQLYGVVVALLVSAGRHESWRSRYYFLSRKVVSIYDTSIWIRRNIMIHNIRLPAHLKLYPQDRTPDRLEHLPNVGLETCYSTTCLHGEIWSSWHLHS